MENNTTNEVNEFDEILWNLAHVKELIVKTLHDNDDAARLNREISMIISDLKANVKDKK